MKVKWKQFTILFGLSLIPIVIFSAAYMQTLYNPYELTMGSSYDEFVDELELNIDNLRRTYAVPGVSIGFLKNNKTHYITSGRDNFFKKQPITLDSVFQIASMSKTQCALGIMNLFQDGLLNLDVPVDTYLTRWEFPDSPYNDEVTIRRILCHAAGLNIGAVNVGAFNPNNLPLIEDALTKEGLAVIVEPGTQYLYSGGGFGLLQLIIEEVSGQSYQDYMEQSVFIPMNMNRTQTYLACSKDNVAVPHTKFRLPFPIYHTAIEAAAGHYSSVRDMLMLCQKMISNSSILSQSNANLMLTPQWGEDWGYGLGFTYENLANGTTIFGHGGDNTGSHGTYWFSPTSGDAIVVLTNGEWGSALVSQILDGWKTIVGENLVDTTWKVQWQGEKVRYLTWIITESTVAIILLGFTAFAIFKNWFHIHREEDGSTRYLIKPKWLRIVILIILILLITYLLLRWDFFNYEFGWDPPLHLWTLILQETTVIFFGVSLLKFRIMNKK